MAKVAWANVGSKIITRLNKLAFLDENTYTPSVGDTTTWDGSQWVPDNGTYGRAVALDIRDYGAALDGATSDVTAVTDALAALPAEGGTVVISGGDCYLDSVIDLIGCPATRATNSEGGPKHVYIASDARVIVPDGHTGTVFRFLPSPTGQLTYGCSVTGRGDIADLSNGRAYTAFEWIASNGGTDGPVHNCAVGDVHVDDAGTVFRLEASANAVASAAMLNVDVHYPVKVWDLVNAGAGGMVLASRASGVVVQALTAVTTHIADGVDGKGHEWHDCWVYDADASVEFNVDGGTRHSLVGGNLTEHTFNVAGDNRFRVQVLDLYSPTLRLDDEPHQTRPLVPYSPATKSRIANENIVLLSDGSTESAGVTALPPEGWTTVDVYAWVMPTDTAGGDVVVSLRRVSLGDGDTANQPGATVGTATVTLSTTQYQIEKVLVASGVSRQNDGEFLSMRLERLGGDAGDTYTGDLGVLDFLELRKAS